MLFSSRFWFLISFSAAAGTELFTLFLKMRSRYSSGLAATAELAAGIAYAPTTFAAATSASDYFGMSLPSS